MAPEKKNRKVTKAAKQVLITINRAGLEEWNRFEEYCRRYKVNKSRLIRQLVGNYLKEESPLTEPVTIEAGRFRG